MVVGDPFLLVVVQVVILDVRALAGQGGEGSGVGWWLAASDGGPGRRGGGWLLGGCGVLALWPCAFNASKIRRAAADGFCGRLQGVAVLVPRRHVVRRLRRRLGFLGLVSGSDCGFFRQLGVLCANFWVFL